MKKFKYLALFAAILTLGACSYEMKDNFDKDATTRAKEALEQYAKTLQNAPNGWIVYYYADTSFGGYNLYCKFDNDSVLAMSEISAPYSEKSHYKLEQSAGIVLSFDEYNNVIHYFSDPINPDGVGDRGYGFEGDHEWRIISCTDELIVLRGKKHSSRIEMVPLPSGYTPEQYFEELKAVIDDMNAANIYTTVDDEIIETTKNATYNVFNFILPQENGTTVTYRRPFIYKLDGIYLYSDLEYNGHTIKGFKYVPGAAAFDEFTDENVTLHLSILPINQQLVEGAWYVASEADLGPVAGPIYRERVDALYTGEKEECVAVYLGAGYNTLDPSTIHYYYRSGSYGCMTETSYEYIGEDAIKINTFPTTSSGALNSNSWAWYCTNYNLETLANVFNSTFDIIEYDNLKAPTYVIIKDRNNGQNVIRLQKQSVSYPLGQHN